MLNICVAQKKMDGGKKSCHNGRGYGTIFKIRPRGIDGVEHMDENHLTSEDLDRISELQAKKDAEEHYTERPKSQRMLAWVLIGLLLLGIFFYCYWQMTPLV